MTAYTIFPKLVKVIEEYDDWQWNRKIRTFKGYTFIVGKYYIAEHSKTYPLEIGDCFIIKQKWDKYGK